MFVLILLVLMRQVQDKLHFVWVLHAQMAMIVFMAIVIVTMPLILAHILHVLMLQV
jgi:hypothetical protein